MQWIVRQHAEVEMIMNSVERIKEYTSLEQEPPAVVESCRPPEGVMSIEIFFGGRKDWITFLFETSGRIKAVLKLRMWWCGMPPINHLF